MPFVSKILQERLDSVFMYNSQFANTQEKAPLTNLLRNDLNAGALQSLLINEDGQQLDLRLVHKLPNCNPVVKGCVTNACADGNTATTHESTAYTLVCNADNTHSIATTMSYADYQNASALMDRLPDLTAPLSETMVNGTNLEDEVLTLISALDLSCEAAIGTKMVAGVHATTFGFSPDEIPSIPAIATDKGKAVKTTGTGVALTTELFSSARMSAEMAEFKSDPILIGGYPLSKYLETSGALCCGSNGVNLGELINSQKSVILRSDAYSKAMIAAFPLLAGNLATMPFVMGYDPGSVQLINRFTYAGKFAVSNGLTLKKQIFSPFTSRPMGLTIAMATCGEKVTIRVETTENVVFRPETQCSGTASFGTNGLLQFVIKN